MTIHDRDGKQLIAVPGWPTIAFLAGLVVLFIGERVIGDPARLRFGIDGVAALALLAGLGGRARELSRSADVQARGAHGWLLGAMGLALLGVTAYFAIDLCRESLRDVLGKGFARIDGAFAVLWPALIVAGTLPLLLMQRALLSMTDGAGHAEHIELRRVTYSAQAGLTIAGALVFCFGFDYIADQFEFRYDLARSRSTRPSAATQKIIEGLGKPLRATLFFATANEVREQIEPYFADLARRSPRFAYEVVDHAISPRRAKELEATGNGLVIIGIPDESGAVRQKETVQIGTRLEAAESALATFDGEMQKRLLQLTRPGRVAYFTVGHGERALTEGARELQKEDLRAPISGLNELLIGQGYEVKTLGIGEGLTNRVPDNAGLVFVAGATERFLPEEVAALSRYLQDGGHVFLMLDPDAESPAADLAPLLKLGGIKYHPETLCNNENYWPRAHEKADFSNIVAQSFSSHASVSTLARAGGRAAVVLPRSGWFDKDDAASVGVQLDFTIRSMPQTWADTTRDFNPGKDETLQTFNVAAAASKGVGDAKGNRTMRMVAFGSIDAATDLVLGHRPNQVLALDAIKWLVGDEDIAAEGAQEQDLPIVHTRGEDRRWFYLTVFLAPLLILAGGLVYTRRARRKRAA